MLKAFSIFLQSALLLIGIAVVFALIKFPLLEGRAANLDKFSIYTDPLILYIYIASIPFFMGLFKLIQFVTIIQQQKAFSIKAVASLKFLRKCMMAWIILMLVAVLMIKFFIAKEDDPAGFIALCLLGIFVSLLAYAITFIIERILQNGIALLEENKKLIMR